MLRHVYTALEILYVLSITLSQNFPEDLKKPKNDWNLWLSPKYKRETPSCDDQIRNKRSSKRTLNRMNEFDPWLVFIKSKSLDHGIQEMCAGALISPEWITTTGYCLRDKSKKSFIVYSNMRDQYRLIDIIFVHQDFDLQSRLNDIALMKTQEPFFLNENTFPACIQHPRDKVLCKNSCELGFKSSYPSYLSTMDREKCKRYYENFGHNVQITENVECLSTTTEHMGSTESCMGIPGTPLTCQTRKGKSVLTGVLSFGWTCIQFKSPAVFTKVSKYDRWITDMISDRSGPNTVICSENDEGVRKKELNTNNNSYHLDVFIPKFENKEDPFRDMTSRKYIRQTFGNYFPMNSDLFAKPRFPQGLSNIKPDTAGLISRLKALTPAPLPKFLPTAVPHFPMPDFPTLPPITIAAEVHFELNFTLPTPLPIKFPTAVVTTVTETDKSLAEPRIPMPMFPTPPPEITGSVPHFEQTTTNSQSEIKAQIPGISLRTPLSMPEFDTTPSKPTESIEPDFPTTPPEVSSNVTTPSPGQTQIPGKSLKTPLSIPEFDTTPSKPTESIEPDFPTKPSDVVSIVTTFAPDPLLESKGQFITYFHGMKPYEQTLVPPPILPRRSLSPGPALAPMPLVLPKPTPVPFPLFLPKPTPAPTPAPTPPPGQLQARAGFVSPYFNVIPSDQPFLLPAKTKVPLLQPSTGFHLHPTVIPPIQSFVPTPAPIDTSPPGAMPPVQPVSPPVPAPITRGGLLSPTPYVERYFPTPTPETVGFVPHFPGIIPPTVQPIVSPPTPAPPQPKVPLLPIPSIQYYFSTPTPESVGFVPHFPGIIPPPAGPVIPPPTPTPSSVPVPSQVYPIGVPIIPHSNETIFCVGKVCPTQGRRVSHYLLSFRGDPSQQLPSHDILLKSNAKLNLDYVKDFKIKLKLEKV